MRRIRETELRNGELPTTASPSAASAARGLIASVLAAAMALLLAAPAASGDEHIVPPADIEPVDCTFHNGEIADNIILVFCTELRLDGGEAKFGSVESEVGGPIVLRQLIGVQTNAQQVPIEEENGNGGLDFPAIEVPGGLLGAAGLDELASLVEPLEAVLDPVLGVRAAIRPLGELEQTEPDQDAFFAGDGVLTTASIPLRVKVENLTLGDRCFIGGPDQPIDLNLDVELTEGYRKAGESEPISRLLGPGFGRTSWALLSVADDAFAVPGARGCGIAGAGGLLAGLGLGNPFNQLINDSVGLPSPAGENLLGLDGWFGVQVCLRHSAQDCIWPLTAVNSPLEFGEVPVGDSSSPQALAFEHTGSEPVTISEPSRLAGSSTFLPSWQITDDGCQGLTMSPGDTCEVEVAFAPDRTGLSFVNIELRGDGIGALAEARVRGTGVEP